MPDGHLLRASLVICLGAALLLLPQATLAEPPPCPADQPEPVGRLAVASYNVQFATPEVPILRHLLREIPGHKPNVPERAQAIATRLACFDVIGLQETINEARRAELFEHLEQAGRECGKPSRLRSGRMFQTVDGPDIAGETGWLPLLDDELALATRLPIVATAMTTFDDAAGIDALVAKGVVHARLAVGSGPNDVLDVFVTHLQADAERDDVRRAQITELAVFVQASAHDFAPVIVMGDFNVWGGRPDRADPASEYNALLAA